MTLSLAPVLDTAAAGPLRLALCEAVNRGEPLLLDGVAVERAGQACFQVLLAGQAAAGRAGLSFRIADPSPPLVELATLAGLDDLLA
ncbi:STAS domain-containing protein [Sphingomonas rubra]|uniref:Anti-anti-sigma regulatory factor (Antagonist of anti-sigma factor) n=1 Tax=Sphingomonas rubra TaxID=634430 RepID=A0A1I5SMZ1_9SPHN|nr:STAS domain-containing protein [Sphingomonas rubra]SFP72085.1 Anti-anti-sigma regulatory factor (antagonist of anti-sigma factor) [Sphingomonas rubra]